jgi:hypothetical protein
MHVRMNTPRVCVCMYMCMYEWILHLVCVYMYICTCRNVYASGVYIHVYIYICQRIRLWDVCTGICIHVSMYTPLVYVDMCTCARMSTRLVMYCQDHGITLRGCFQERGLGGGLFSKEVVFLCTQIHTVCLEISSPPLKKAGANFNQPAVIPMVLGKRIANNILK